ncbi:uncharacterized protein [Hetaerina americana]|uniref:uncharacterized protein n=1 Tax=Hetaerina americana TaxID=62018 RepID=UPI003A7F5138
MEETVTYKYVTEELSNLNERIDIDGFCELFSDNLQFLPSDLLKPRKRCPLCDASVYPYCSEKLFHDACCCLDPIDTPLPYQCRYADCSFLHANSCQEHKLITACCCTRAFLYLRK